MASPVNLGIYSDAMIVLATAGVLVPVISRIGVNPIIGYLAFGALLGPMGLGSHLETFPFLYWLTIVEPGNVSAIAELGIVFLLFLIGLELSFARLIALRRLVFGLGFLQIVLSAAALTLMARLVGLDMVPALLVGTSLSLSSTAMVIEILAAKRRMATIIGRTSFAVLLAQDIAVVPLLMLVGILAAGSTTNMAASIGMALLQAVASLAVIVLLGRVFIRPLFRLVGSLRSPEVFLAAILFVIVGAGFVASLFGLSMALGAFVAGLLLSETEYRKAVEAIVEPFKGLLLGVFFFTVGMSIDLALFASAPFQILMTVALMILIKTLVMVPLSRAFGVPMLKSIELSLLLAPGGEFAFVALGAGVSAGLLTQEKTAIVLTAVAVSMALLPLIANIAGRLVAKIRSETRSDPALEVQPADIDNHVIVVGYGRVGKVVAGLLERHSIPYTAIDSEGTLVSRERRKSDRVYFGNAADPNFLRACGLERASAMIMTVQDDHTTDHVIDFVRAMRPDMPIVARARDATHARHLYALGVTTAVPETIEASLQLSEATLICMGIPMGKVIASIHDRRDEFRKELQ